MPAGGYKQKDIDKHSDGECSSIRKPRQTRTTPSGATIMSNDEKKQDRCSSSHASDDWTSMSLTGPLTKKLNNNDDATIVVSNPAFPLPDGLDVMHDFVTASQADDILQVLDESTFRWNGFEQRHKLWEFDVADTSVESDARSHATELPQPLHDLVERFRDQMGMQPTTISIEEYPLNQLKRRERSTWKGTVTTFESTQMCNCSQPTLNDGVEHGIHHEDTASTADPDTQDPTQMCGCFVAEIPLCIPLVEQLNRPKLRKTTCWEFLTIDHWTGLILEPNTMYLKTKECLWDWRTRIASTADLHVDSKEDRALVLKLARLPKVDSASKSDSNFGYVPPPGGPVRRKEPMPPIKDLLTVIVTTSPIKSNPSTELLEKTLATFPWAGHDFAFKCRKVIVCDGCRQKDGTTSKKHGSAKQAMRNGLVDSQQWENYQEFKQRLTALCADAPDTSPFANTRVEELDARHGYGFALRHALHHCVSTPYVIVIQHDRTFMRPLPLADVMRTMWHNVNIKYVGMSQRSNLMYRDNFLSKYGSTFMDDASRLTLRPPELALDANKYGPNSDSTRRLDVGGRAELQANIAQLAATYMKSHQQLEHESWLQNNPQPPDVCRLSLTPTFFWYDNTHICETAHYRDFIFDPKYRMVARGGFVEDKVSPVIKKTVARLGLIEGHARFGCFLLDDHSGMFFTGHLDGGSYTPLEERKAMEAKRRKQKGEVVG